MALRQLFAVVALPTTVTILVPLWLRRRYSLVAEAPATVFDWVSIAAGLVAFGIGLSLFAASLSRFIVQGKGTLAPWDPPRHLVVTGPYRYVRNPMISGVVFILVGEALLLRDRAARLVGRDLHPDQRAVYRECRGTAARAAFWGRVSGLLPACARGRATPDAMAAVRSGSGPSVESRDDERPPVG